MFLRERRIAVFVELRLTLVRFGARQLRFRLLKLRLSLRQLAVRLGELSPRLIRRGLKWTRIDLEKQLALPDERAFRIVLREEVAGDLGTDGGVHHPIQGSGSSSATTSDPTPYGTDIDGKPLNDPIPDTVLNASTGSLISAPATGTSVLLDQWTITKPDVSGSVHISLSAPDSANPGGTIPYSILIQNNGTTPLNGTQIRLTVPIGVTSAAMPTDPVTVQGSDIVYTIGRLAPGSEQTVQINVQITDDNKHVDMIRTQVSLTSGTAEPVAGNSVTTKVKQG